MMSLRSFVSLCSVLLIAWMALAFVHSSGKQSGMDSKETVLQPEPKKAGKIENLAVSTSP